MINPIESIKEFGGYLNRYQHETESCQCKMTFSIYFPPQAKKQKVPVLYWLSGLTCTDDNARTKAGMQRYAAEQGIAIVFPDTSPRGNGVADEIDRYDLGQGAGFYVNAVLSPWQKNYQMYDYISHELPTFIESNFPELSKVKSIFGHSMGGHGALVIALRNPTAYRSVSAFSPILNPTLCDWGKTCFATYLGEDRAAWASYDATELIKLGYTFPDILIDQGLYDEFYDQQQLLPENFRSVCDDKRQALTLRMQKGYDHSYHFIASFIGEHIVYHGNALKK